MERQRLRAVGLGTLALLAALVGLCTVNGGLPCPPGLRAQAIAEAGPTMHVRLAGEPTRITCTPTGLGTWYVGIEGPITSFAPFGDRRSGYGSMWMYLNEQGVAYNHGGGPDPSSGRD